MYFAAHTHTHRPDQTRPDYRGQPCINPRFQILGPLKNTWERDMRSMLWGLACNAKPSAICFSSSPSHTHTDIHRLKHCPPVRLRMSCMWRSGATSFTTHPIEIKISLQITPSNNIVRFKGALLLCLMSVHVLLALCSWCCTSTRVFNWNLYV